MIPTNRTNHANSNLFLKLLVSATVTAVVTASALAVMALSVTRQDVYPLEPINTANIVSTALETNIIPNNIYVNDVHVGGLTRGEALRDVENILLHNIGNNTLTVVYENMSFEFLFSDFYDLSSLEGTIEAAYRHARRGTETERLNVMDQLSTTPLRLNIGDMYDESIVYSKISELSAEINIDPVNATMSRYNRRFTIEEESAGRTLNVESTVERVMEQLATNTSGTVEAKVDIAPPTVIADELQYAQSLLGTFTTTVTGSMELGRNINIIVAANNINNVMVEPGEVFSTNYHFGVTTRERGFRPAAVIVNGQFVDMYGGGVCQVSSTLYIALLYAELEIVERRNHSLMVSYVDPGFDATLARDLIDLRFRNTTPYPVFVESFLEGNRLTVNIFGYESRPSDRRLRFEYTHIETVQPEPELVTEDPSLPLGERVVTRRARTGERYQVHRYAYEGGVLIDRVLINTSFYRPVRAEVRVGTGPAVAVYPPTQYEVEVVEQETAVDNTEVQYTVEYQPTSVAEIVAEPITVVEPTVEIVEELVTESEVQIVSEPVANAEIVEEEEYFPVMPY